MWMISKRMLHVVSVTWISQEETIIMNQDNEFDVTATVELLLMEMLCKSSLHKSCNFLKLSLPHVTMQDE